MGVLNLCYRGNRYKLKDGILSFNAYSRVSPASAASYKFQARTMDEVDTNVEVELKDGVISVNLDSHVSPSEAASYEFQARTMDKVDTKVKILGVIMIQQYNLRKGLELYGDKAEAATVKELSQIHEMGKYVPSDAGVSVLSDVHCREVRW